ncbi:MAG: FmdB family zinc ribbon protein [Ignavibacteriaceae bacterium]
MPTYDYVCNNCGYKFELFQKMSDEAIKECPKCKGNVKRLIGTGAGTIFKGSGFYQTDYKNTTQKNDNKDNKENKESTKKETKTETTPAKPETKTS